MAKPLDIEPKAFGFLKVKNLYLVVLTFIFALTFIPALAKPFGFKGALFLAMGLLFLEILYFALSNNLPENFLFNYLRFQLGHKQYFPGPEKSERIEP